MKRGTVTVVIPCFNSSRFLARTLQGVLAQSHQPFEIIAVDDGSTDDTPRILAVYRARVHMLTHPHRANRGLSRSLNLGIAHARGDLIAFLDHDDVWFADKLSTQVDAIAASDEIGVVYCNGYAIDERDEKLFCLLPPQHREVNLPSRLLLDNYIRSCSAVLARRDLLLKAGMFKAGCLCADHDLWLKCMELAAFRYVPSCLYGYRMHVGQSSLQRKLWEDGFSVLEDACQRRPYGAHIRRKRLAVLHYRLGRHDFTERRYIDALHNLALAGRYDPRRALSVARETLSGRIARSWSPSMWAREP